MKTAFLFPGQGAQHVGMGRDLYEAFPAAKSIFDQAEAVTHLPLQKLCFQGPEDQLARTDMSQPAIFTVSAALLSCLSELLSPAAQAAIAPAYLAGLSLGEYTALYAAGAVDLATALGLVTRRGQAMQAAATAVPSGMVSILGLDEAKAAELAQAAAEGQVLVCANFNAPGQIVLSGAIEACHRAQALAKDFGATGAVPLKVAGAFHSPLMQPAAEELAEALDQAELAAPNRPVVANVDAACYGPGREVAGKLLAQLVSPVRWQQSMEFLLAQGVQRFYEIGPGRVLAGLMKRIQRQAEVACINSVEALEKLSASL
ncbi:MAG: ACP S-malonyltransferase [Phycisphaerae bacterium]|nr:ACP S-malonyltransferase [Phycisphaerae bacterium]